MSEIHIDGSVGEGGGQILRTALALAAITDTPVHFENIRAGRGKPGLLRQHLTALRAAAEISGAEVEGDELRSMEVRFRPGSIRGGNYTFSVGTAGSACLVCQTVLPILLHADGPSEVLFEGGTHNMSAPSFDYIARAFVPLLRKMGLSVEVELIRHGFYPAGGGSFRLRVEPRGRMEKLELLEAGELRGVRAEALFANLPFHVAERELKVVSQKLGVGDDDLAPREVKSPGPGNVLTIEVERDTTELVTAFGRQGRKAEQVAREAVKETRRLLAAEVPVGAHLADQLLLPFGLAGGGVMRTLPLSEHSRTNIGVIQRFMDVPTKVEIDEERGVTQLEMGR